MKKPKIGTRICEWCSKSYTPTSNHQKFCKTSCKSQASGYWQMKDPPEFWVCPSCGVRHKLSFNITEEKKKWENIKCSACKKRRNEINPNEIIMVRRGNF